MTDTVSSTMEKLVAEGIASLVPIGVCQAFDEYISKAYPWEINGYRLDWTQHAFHERVLWDSVSDDQVAIFMANSGLSKYRRICAISARDEPGVMVSFDYAKDNVDVLSCLSAGTVFLVAVADRDLDRGEIQLVQDCFVEIDGSTGLTASF
jgi:hypothetical protein